MSGGSILISIATAYSRCGPAAGPPHSAASPRALQAGLLNICTVCCSMQIPSNFMLSRVGAKRWLSFVIITWGCIAVASAGLQNSAQFMALRVLLGAAEAGTFPGRWHGKRLLQINAYHCAWSPAHIH